MLDIIKMFGILKKEEKDGIFVGESIFELSKRKTVMLRQNGSYLFDRYVWKKRRRRITIIPSEETTPHMIIVGMSGFGKSTLLKSMISDIKNGAGQPYSSMPTTSTRMRSASWVGVSTTPPALG